MKFFTHFKNRYFLILRKKDNVSVRIFHACDFTPTMFGGMDEIHFKALAEKCDLKYEPENGDTIDVVPYRDDCEYLVKLFMLEKAIKRK